MPYRKPRYASRKHLPPDRNFIRIPLPNEIEGSFLHKRIPRDGLNLASVVEFIQSRITIEEIVLIVVLIILLGEEIKDEFLILMLLYILIF
jgi:hypothetical protein